MSARLGRLGRLAAVAALGCALVAPTNIAAVADPVSDCSTSTGVLVVVDSRPFGDKVARGCDATPTTGLDALEEAGFEVTGTARYGTAFVCRINGEPSNDRCVNTPPASAYWSYWHASSGQQSWTYSKLGASSYRPKAGSIDAWVFGATDVGGTTGGPCFSPADARAGRATACSTAPKPAPTKTEAQSTRTAGDPARGRTTTPGPSTATPRATGTRAAASTGRASSVTKRPAASSSAMPTTTTTTTPPTASPATGSAPAIVDATPVAGDRSSGGGSALPLVLVGGLVVILGGGAGWTVLRRRRADADL